MFKQFVYGTLKTGEFNNRIMDGIGAVSLGEGRIFDSPFMLFEGYGFPYAVSLPAFLRDEYLARGVCNYIVGELFDVPDEGQLRLDRLEGYPYHYGRVPVEVVRQDASAVDALIYFVGPTVDVDPEIRYGKILKRGVWNDREENLSNW